MTKAENANSTSASMRNAVDGETEIARLTRDLGDLWTAYEQASAAHDQQWATFFRPEIPTDIQAKNCPERFVEALKHFNRDAVNSHFSLDRVEFVTASGWKTALTNEAVRTLCPDEFKGGATAWLSRRLEVAQAYEMRHAETFNDPALAKSEEDVSAAYDAASALEQRILSLRPATLSDLALMAAIALRNSDDADFDMTTGNGVALARAIQSFAEAA